jgi:hypothetical protein
MPRLPKFSRVLIVVPPHGGYIVSGKKKVLVKSKRYHMENEVLLVVEKKTAIGTIVVGPPHKITLAQFKSPKMRALHLVTEEERKRWWGGKSQFNVYPVVKFRKLRAPVPVDYKQGAQVFVRKDSLRIRRSASQRHASYAGPARSAPR